MARSLLESAGGGMYNIRCDGRLVTHAYVDMAGPAGQPWQASVSGLMRQRRFATKGEATAWLRRMARAACRTGRSRA